MSILNTILSPMLFSLAVRNLMRNKTRTLLSVLGIIIGIFAICTLGMAGTAFTETIDDMAEKNGNLLMVAANSDDENTPRYDFMVRLPSLSENDAARIDKAVKAVTPDYTSSTDRYVLRPLVINQNDEVSALYMFGEKDNLEVLLGTQLREGHLPRMDTDILLTSEFADRFNLRVGNHLKTTTDGGTKLNLKITGIVEDSLLGAVYSITQTPNLILAPDELYSILYKDTSAYSHLLSGLDGSSPLSDNSSIISLPQIIPVKLSTSKNLIEPKTLFIDYETLSAIFLELLKSGSLPSSYNDILVFAGFAEKYHLDVGYKLLQETTANGEITLNISGIIDDSYLSSLEITQEYIVGSSDLYNLLSYDINNDYKYVMIRLDDLTLREPVKNAIEREMNGNRRTIDDDRISVRDFTAMAKDLQEILSMAVKLGIAVSAIALIIASVSITNIMIISVKERKQEIGLMRSVGTTRRQIMVMFLFEAGLIGIFGSLIGVLISVAAISALLYLIMHTVSYLLLPSVWMYIPIGIIIGILVCLVSGLYPAIKAAYLNPAEAMER